MIRKTTVLAVVALVVVGTSAVLAAGAVPTATDDAAAVDGAPLAQETTTAADDTADEETTMEGEMETTQNATASVIFLNQSAGFTFTDGAPNTTTVTLERVVVPEGGFLVIHEAQNVSGVYESADNVSVGGVVGNSTYLEPGVHSNVVVELDEAVNESQTLVAMPHRDTNDNQQYDFPEADAPYTSDGSPVIETAYVIVEYDVIDLTFGEDGQQTTMADETMGNETMGDETTEA